MRRGYGILFLCASFLLILCLACQDTGYYSFLKPGKEPDPELRVTPNGIILNAVEDEDDPTGKLAVKNTGLRTLSWSAELTDVDAPGDWLFIDLPAPAEGELVRPTLMDAAPSEDVTIRAQITSPSLPAGYYSGQVVVTAPEAEGSPQQVEVELYLNEAGATAISILPPAQELSFWCYENKGEVEEDTVSVQNSGGGWLYWQASDDRAWLTLDPATGLSTGEWDLIDVTADPTSFHGARGRYQATITILDTNPPGISETVDVDFDVFRKPMFDPATFGEIQFRGLEEDLQDAGYPGSQQVQVRNAGDRELNWSAEWSSGWIDVTADFYTSDGPKDVGDEYDPTIALPNTDWNTITVAADLTDLRISTGQEKVFTDKVVLSAPQTSNSPVEIPVSLTLRRWKDDFSDGNAIRDNWPDSYVNWEEYDDADWSVSSEEYRGSAGPGEKVTTFAGNPEWDDFEFKADVRRGSADAVSLLFRAKAIDRYYEVYADGTYVRLYEVTGGGRLQRASKSYGMSMFLFYTLTVQVYKTTGGAEAWITVFVEGDKLFSYNDKSPIDKGRIGLLVEDGGTSYFDNVVVKQLEEIKKPELRIASITPTRSKSMVGDPINVTVQVRNGGNAAASNVRLDFWTHRSTAPSVGSASSRNQTVGRIAAGGYANFTFSNLVSSGRTTWDMYAVVDTNDTIDEFDETNNVGGPEQVEWVYDVYEPDDLYTQAKTITNGETQTRTMMPSYDDDWVTFTIGSMSDVYIWTTRPAYYQYIGLYLYLYDSTGFNVVYNSAGSYYDYDYYGWCGAYFMNLPAGTYYIYLYSYSRTGTYYLHLDIY